MKMYLVINQPRNNLGLLYKDQYKLFSDLKNAKKHAIDCGMVDPFGMGINTAPGQMNMYWAGDVRVSILPLEVEDKKI
jgi:hypothetical protein